MSEIASLLQAVGCVDVRTLLQSGNVVLSSGLERAELEIMIEEAIEARFGFRASAFVRSSLASIVEGNPFPEAAAERASHLVVFFHREPPLVSAVEELQARILGPEKLAVGGGHLFVDYPDGIGPSKVDRTPGWREAVASGTGRNWNTVLKLSTLLEASIM